MFGVLVSGKIPQTNFEHVSANQLIATLTNAESIKHVGVFLTGKELFPEDTCGIVFFSWPNPDQPTQWQPLGFISNEKPSAIFKISSTKNETNNDHQFTFASNDSSIQNAQIGISLEPVENILNYTWPEPTTADLPAPILLDISQQILSNFFNYAYSFVISQANMQPDPNETYIPISVLKNWNAHFQRKLKFDHFGK